MSGKRPLVDRTIKSALFSYKAVHGAKLFTASFFYSWMMINELIPNNCHGFNGRMVDNRLAFWAKTDTVPELVLVSKWDNSGNSNTYKME